MHPLNNPLDERVARRQRRTRSPGDKRPRVACTHQLRSEPFSDERIAVQTCAIGGHSETVSDPPVLRSANMGSVEVVLAAWFMPSDDSALVSFVEQVVLYRAPTIE